ncbi:hypothetical protein [Spirosoma aerolatum]|uniref:hypothetical protein n=1 Tax=Spirosoma aerolatum TaxID=1211326 RepID=UPI0009AD20BA|nr:hypothetical protein [Spirosoma aerolatum]
MKSLSTFAQEDCLSQQEMKEVVGGATITYIRRRPIIGTDPTNGKKYVIPNTTVIGTNPDGSQWAIL